VPSEQPPPRGESQEEAGQRDIERRGSGADADADKGNGSPAAAIPIAPEVLNKLPPQARAQVESIFASAAFYGPVPNPIAQKVTSEHVGKLLENEARGTELEAADRKDARRFAVGFSAFIALLVVALILVLTLTDHADVLDDVIRALVLFGGGFGGGFGFSEWRHKRER
jgi:hypothetical protein